MFDLAAPLVARVRKKRPLLRRQYWPLSHISLKMLMKERIRGLNTKENCNQEKIFSLSQTQKAETSRKRLQLKQLCKKHTRICRKR
jgi:hypothetical protein